MTECAKEICNLQSKNSDEHLTQSPFTGLFFRYRNFAGTGGAVTGTGGAVCKGATPSVEQPGGRGFKPWLRSLLD
jgi:hypothetical protein